MLSAVVDPARLLNTPYMVFPEVQSGSWATRSDAIRSKRLIDRNMLRSFGWLGKGLFIWTGLRFIKLTVIISKHIWNLQQNSVGFSFYASFGKPELTQYRIAFSAGYIQIKPWNLLLYLILADSESYR